ncbi:MAG: hypothetical protein Q4C42_06385 [Clostridia bacterium]|nr:hypothetical protein [Clostridia bacterium]
MDTMNNTELEKYLKIISDVKDLLQNFANKDDAVDYLVKETGLPLEECKAAYDFYMKPLKKG